MNGQGYISTEEVRHALRQIYRSDAESNLQTTLLQLFADELKPIDQKGRYRPSPSFVLTFVLLCALLGIFVYFSLGGPR